MKVHGTRNIKTNTSGLQNPPSPLFQKGECVVSYIVGYSQESKEFPSSK